jgi:hypothetical protein
MKTDLATVLNSTAESARHLHRVRLDEPVDFWVGVVDSASLVDDLLESAAGLTRGEYLTVVLGLPIEQPPVEAAHMLERARAVAHTAVLITSADDHRWDALALTDPSAPPGATDEKRVLIEPDAERAVSAAMQWLRPGCPCCVLWPRGWGVPALQAAIACGARWREAWDAPQEGELHVIPRESCGALIEHVATPVDDESEEAKSEDRRDVERS